MEISKRTLVIGLAFVLIVGIAFWLGESLALRFGPTTVRPTEGPQPPNVDLGVLVVAMR